MPYVKAERYKDFILRLRRIESPIKVKHIWVPLAFLLVSLYRNQHIADLSMAEAFVGLAIALLSFLPLFIWASGTEREPPAFQCFCTIHFPYYAYPILSCKEEYMRYPEASRLLAGGTVLVALTVAILVYHLTRRSERSKGPTTLLEYRQLPDSIAGLLFTLLLTGWLSFVIVRNFGMIRLGSATNTVNSFATGGGIVSAWTLARLFGERKLSLVHGLFVLAVILTGLAVSFATGSLISGLTMLIVSVVAFSLGRSKIPWTVIVIALACVSFLNLGKAEMRRVFWRQHAPTLTIEKMISVYEYWIPAAWKVMWRGEQTRRIQGTSLMDRANLIQMQSLVVDKTPEPLDFLWGQTYQYIPTNLVPRIFWTEKPHGNMATEVMGLRYGITNRQQLRTTTIGFGALAEAWVNFGWGGIIGYAILMAAAMRLVANATAGARPNSMHMLLSVVWVAHSFQIEQSLSSWISSLFQAIVAILVIIYPFTRPTRPSPPIVAAEIVPSG